MEEKTSKQARITIQGRESITELEDSKSSKDKVVKQNNPEFTLPNTPKRSSVTLALKILVIDTMWSMPTALICLGLTFVYQRAPTNYFCSMLRHQERETKNPNITPLSTLLEIIWYNMLHLAPIFTCIWLMDDFEVKSWLRYLSQAYARWNKAFFYFAATVAVDITYRLAIFFIYPLNDLSYPPWFFYPLNGIWICGLLVIAKIASNVWIAKHTTNFVIQFKLTQGQVQKQSKKVKRSILRKVVLSQIIPACLAVMFQVLMEFFQVRNENDRQIMIVICMFSAYPLWMWIDREGRSSLPWSHSIRHIEDARNANHPKNDKVPEMRILHRYSMLQDDKHTISSSLHCIERNGYVLSAFVMVGVITTVRILQANMETLKSKVVTGLMASTIEKVFILLEPHVEALTNKLVKKFSKLVQPKVNIFDQLQSEILKQEKETKKSVFQWQRSHAVVMMNRINIFSILLSNVLVILGSNERMRAHKSNSLKTDGHNICEGISTISDSLISIFVLYIIEITVSFVAYTYMIRVENLPLDQVYKKKKMSGILFFYAIMISLYMVSQYLTIVYGVTSCGDQSMYEYHCVVS